MENLISSKYLTKTAVLETLAISERNLENIVREQKFPPGVKIGKKLYWSREVIEMWLEAQFAKQLDFKTSSRRSMSRLNRH